jgi:hypothetical protein
MCAVAIGRRVGASVPALFTTMCLVTMCYNSEISPVLGLNVDVLDYPRSVFRTSGMNVGIENGTNLFRGFQNRDKGGFDLFCHYSVAPCETRAATVPVDVEPEERDAQRVMCRPVLSRVVMVASRDLLG